MIIIILIQYTSIALKYMIRTRIIDKYVNTTTISGPYQKTSIQILKTRILGQLTNTPRYDYQKIDPQPFIN